MKNCKCADCGLLATYTGSSEFISVPPMTRNSGENASGCAGLYCAARVIDFKEEVLAIDSPAILAIDSPAIPDKQKRKTVLHKDRQCHRFIQHQIGMTLRDHLELIRMIELEQMRTEQRARDLEWQAEQRRTDQAFQIKQKRWDRVVQISTTVINVILTAAIGILLVKLGLKEK